MKFTESHEWIYLDKDVGVVGITPFAKKELGEIVFVEFPKIGSQLKKGQEVCVLESTKAAADIYAPVSGIILEINDKIEKEVGAIHTLPEKEDWLFKMQLTYPKEYESLLDLEEYNRLIIAPAE